MKVNKALLEKAGLSLSKDKPKGLPSKEVGKVVDITYDKEKANLEQVSSETVSTVTAQNVDYATKLGFTVTQTLREALIRRANGEKVMSPREADTVCRMKVDITSPMLNAILTEYTAFIIEGEIYEEENPWMLRYRYNNGIHWRKYQRPHATLDNQEAGDLRLAYLATKLEVDFGLPLHQIELDNGVNPELCRPEPITPDQFIGGKYTGKYGSKKRI